MLDVLPGLPEQAIIADGADSEIHAKGIVSTLVLRFGRILQLVSSVYSPIGLRITLCRKSCRICLAITANLL